MPLFSPCSRPSPPNHSPLSSFRAAGPQTAPACPEIAPGDRRLSLFLASDPKTLPFNKLFTCRTYESPGNLLYFSSPRLCASARDSIFAVVPHQPAHSAQLPKSSFRNSPIFNAMLRHPGYTALQPRLEVRHAPTSSFPSPLNPILTRAPAANSFRSHTYENHRVGILPSNHNLLSPPCHISPSANSSGRFTLTCLTPLPTLQLSRSPYPGPGT